MTTTDFLIHDTGTGQQLAVSDVHAALAEQEQPPADAVALPVADAMDARAHDLWGKPYDGHMRDLWAAFAEADHRLDAAGLPPRAEPEPAVQWADLPEWSDPSDLGRMSIEAHQEKLKPHPAKQLTPEQLDAEHAAWVRRAQAQAQLATRVQQATERQARHDDDWREQGQVPAQQHPDQPVHRKPRLLGLVDRFIAWHKQRQEQA